MISLIPSPRLFIALPDLVWAYNFQARFPVQINKYPFYGNSIKIMWFCSIASFSHFLDQIQLRIGSMLRPHHPLSVRWDSFSFSFHFSTNNFPEILIFSLEIFIGFFYLPKMAHFPIIMLMTLITLDLMIIGGVWKWMIELGF